MTAAAKQPVRFWRDYRTAADGRPVKAFLDALTDEEVASIVAGMNDVVKRGLAASRRLRGDVYEVRADADTRSFKLEAGGDVKLSTLQRYFAAIGKKLSFVAT